MNHSSSLCPGLTYSSDNPKNVVWNHPGQRLTTSLAIALPIWAIDYCMMIPTPLSRLTHTHAVSLSPLSHWSVSDGLAEDGCGTYFGGVSIFDMSMVQIVVFDCELCESNYSFIQGNHFPSCDASNWLRILSTNFVQSLCVEWRWRTNCCSWMKKL